MALFYRIRLALLALTGKTDHPRWLRERDEARAEVDRYRQVARLSLGEFVGPEVTIEKIEKRLRVLKIESIIDEDVN